MRINCYSKLPISFLFLKNLPWGQIDLFFGGKHFNEPLIMQKWSQDCILEQTKRNLQCSLCLITEKVSPPVGGAGGSKGLSHHLLYDTTTSRNICLQTWPLNLPLLDNHVPNLPVNVNVTPFPLPATSVSSRFADVSSQMCPQSIYLFISLPLPLHFLFTILSLAFSL